MRKGKTQGEGDTFQGLQNIVDHLMGPDGCPWDRDQTHESLKRNLLEECYELIEAIESGSVESMAEELG
ncbi:MAG: MazG nucleotide pyrophosphohydrolase domain-containing protein, partial [Anaerolineales bacterium]|nr:MazG nucleotide pyrophosphohydrolase domain-containing protein [Anaerolineales bacterium]